MRPKGSGYRSQSRLLEVMRNRDICFQEAADILRSRGCANRNLKELISKGLSEKSPSGHKILYSVTKKGKRYTDWEKKRWIKRMLEQPSWFETSEGKEWLRKIPREYDETVDDTELDKLLSEYEDEIAELFKNDKKRLSHSNVYEVIAWAKEYRKWKTERKKPKHYGAREKRIGPSTKKPTAFKPHE